MPANLPPEYFDADKRFKEAITPSEKVRALEDLIATVPKHKGTDKLRADLRKRLSKLREDADKRKKSGKGDPYTVEKEGAGRICLAGLPNSGKSSLLASLTNARPQIADYPMTTVMPLSGMMPYEDIQFQMVDLPPLGNEATDGWVSAIIRNADITLLVIDLSGDADVEAGLLMEMLLKWKCKNIVIAGNKKDTAKDNMPESLKEKYAGSYPLVFVSAKTKEGLEELRQVIFKASGVIRIYSKEPGKEADLSAPFTVPAGTTVIRLAELIHKDFVAHLKYACVWGSAKYPGQRVQRDYVLKDRDIVELHI